MEQEDWLIREIEKMGAVLLALIGRLKADYSSLQFDQELEMVDTYINEIFGMQVDSLIRLPDEQFVALSERVKSLNEANIGLLSDLLGEIARGLPAPDSEAAILKSIRILEMINLRSRTFSFERESKLEELRSRL